MDVVPHTNNYLVLVVENIIIVIIIIIFKKEASLTKCVTEGVKKKYIYILQYKVTRFA